MSFFEYIKVKLLTLRQDQSGEVLHENFQRSSEEMESYRTWLHSREKEQMLTYILQEYKLSKSGNEDNTLIVFLQKPHLQGFTLQCPESMAPSNFQHLHDFFRERVEELGYLNILQERRTIPRPDRTEKIDRYKLKLPTDVGKSLGENNSQNHGTVYIDLFRIGEQPTHLKFVCSYRTARNKATVTSFDRLMEHICGRKEEKVNSEL